MKILIGLGNPGAKYAQNRHNVGFMALDQIASDYGFSPWRRKFQGQICDGHIGSHKTLLLKPETFMNLSGQSAQEALHFYKIALEDVCVVHDELDVAAGKLKVKQGGGHAGHNGLRSLDAHIGKEYYRLRVGIGHPGHKNAVASYVLKDFSKPDQDWLDILLPTLSKEMGLLLDHKAPQFLNNVATAEKPAGKISKTPMPKADPPQVVKVEDDLRSPLEKLRDRFS